LGEGWGEGLFQLEAIMSFDQQRKRNDLLLERARVMRHEPSPAEKKLWQRLRDRQLNGLKFRRQHPVSRNYIADSYCHDAKLVVELDGDSHGDREQYDARRTKRLERDGLHVIRFLNDDVFWHLDAVLEEILRECQTYSENIPSP
jgi:very-short-patch-repair endonuclease